MGGPPGDERRSLVVEWAFADRDGLKASVATVLVILVGEASGLLASIGLGFVETRLKVCADGGIAVDAADAFPFSDAVNLIGHGLPSPPMGQGERRGGRGLPGSVVAIKTGYRSRRPALTSFPAARPLIIAVVRALGQALEAFACERNAVEGFSVLLPLRLAHRPRGEDEIALDDVALDVAAGGLAEDGDFVPTGALDPSAPIVLATVARRDADAHGRADLLDLADSNDE